MSADIVTRSENWTLARRTNSTVNGFTYPPFQWAQPTIDNGIAAAGVQNTHFELGAPLGGTVRNLIKAQFFGAGSDGNTMLARLYSWNKVMTGDVTTEGWLADLLFEATCTFSTFTAVMNGGTARFADTITITSGSAVENVDIVTRSPAANYPATIKVDFEGGGVLTWQFSTGGVSTSCNAITWQSSSRSTDGASTI